VSCSSIDTNKLEIPRDYVTSLENEIAELTKEIQQLRHRAPSDPTVIIDDTTPDQNFNTSYELNTGGHPGSDTDSSPAVQGLVTSVRNVVVQPGHQSLYLGQSSGISFAKMVLAAVHVDKTSNLLLPENQPFQELTVSSTSKASLPPRHVADHLNDVYFQYRTPHLPILSRTQVDKAIDSAYRSLEASDGPSLVPERDMFVAYMVFAIALVDVQHLGGRSSQSDGCFRSALVWAESILTYSKSDLETLRSVLLLAQFVAMSPSQGSLWHLTGFALRLCIEIGLHWETESQSLSTNAELLNDRRCLWYTTYHFDRLMSITLDRPLGILDEGVRVQLPNPWSRSRQNPSQQPDIHIQRAHNHLFMLSKLESEIKHVQQSQSYAVKLAYPRPSWNDWLQDIQPRMQEWHDTVPDPSKAHTQSIFSFQAYWDVIYYNAVLLLYRPSSTSFQGSEDLMISFEAATKVIAGLKVLQREGRVEMLWKSVHHLFMAGLVVIYGLWRSKEIRDQTSIGKGIATLQSCATTLTAMSETFKGAAGCRNAFESLSSATTDWLVSRNIEDQPGNRIDFENQVRVLMNQLKASRDEVRPNAAQIESENNALSPENFDLSELLNAAAQWPDLGELDFVMGGQYET
jgi:hypothetical protein